MTFIGLSFCSFMYVFMGNTLSSYYYLFEVIELVTRPVASWESVRPENGSTPGRVAPKSVNMVPIASLPARHSVFRGGLG